MDWISSQIQMEKLASRHAISELFNWISLMENVIEEDEENLKSAVGSNVIQDYLQKYKVVNLPYRFFRFNSLLTLFTKHMMWTLDANVWQLHIF